MSFSRWVSPFFFLLVACGGNGNVDGPGTGDPDASSDSAGGDVSIDSSSSDTRSIDATPDSPADRCTPACTGKSCGTDGCGASCGTCAGGQVCDASGKCVAECPCFGGDCASCYCGQGVKDYGASHGCAVATVAGHEGDLLSCTGGKWSVGTSCAGAGCNVAPVGTPDTCKGSSTGHKLWIAWDSGPSSCRTNTENFFACILSRSDFPTLESAWSTGRALSWGGSAVLGSACGFHHGTDASVGTDSATFQCIEDQTGWDLHTDDVVMYYPTWSGCSDGRNHWHIPVKTKAGASVSIEIGLGFTSNVCTCQTALGMHEVYEASSDPSSADCCNGQTWAPLHASCSKYAGPSYGWYDLACGGTTYKAQLVSISTNEWDASGCTALTTH